MLPPHIYLTGFMGSGKTHTGRRLASLLAYPFVDLDEWIENDQGRTISEIFATAGESAFRHEEARWLRNLTELPLCVIATGGGAPCHHDNMAYMNQQGLTVFLDPPISVLVERLERERAHRPLLQTGESLEANIRRRLAERRACYETAHLHLRPQAREADVARLIADKLPEVVGH